MISAASAAVRDPVKAGPLLLAVLHNPKSWRARAGAIWLSSILNAQVSLKDS